VSCAGLLRAGLTGAAAILACLCLWGPFERPWAATAGQEALPLSILEERAHNGTASTWYLLGRRYLLGRHAPQNASKGLQWLRMAADKNHPPALLFLAQAYELGRGVPRSFVQAHHWYEKAGAQGVEAARMKLRPLRTADPAEEFLLFEVPLLRTNPFCIRYALQRRGAAPIKTAKAPGCDRFVASSLLEAADQIRICYAPDGGLAHLEYRFPPRPAGKEDPLQGHYRRLVAKYGEPQRTEVQEGVPWKYIWRNQGVRIIFWYRPDRSTGFLRYQAPRNQERLLQHIQEQNATRLRRTDRL
jgi:TPR repeat protein